MHTVRLGVLLGKSSVGTFECRVKVNIVNTAVVCKFKQIGIEAVDIRIKDRIILVSFPLPCYGRNGNDIDIRIFPVDAVNKIAVI